MSIKTWLNQIKIIVLISVSIACVGCAHMRGKDELQQIETVGSDHIDDSSFDDDHRYLYTPPKIYRTWINARVTQSNEVISAHHRYWVGDKGHWNVPIHTETGEGSAILGPAAK